MNKNEFINWSQNRIIYLDGATGTNLAKAGMPGGVCPEEWICKHPEALTDLQTAFLNAGSDIVYAPTFTANRIKLAEYHLEDQMESMIFQLVEASKKAIIRSGRTDAYIAGDLTMTGQQLVPTGTMELEELISVYKEQISILEKAGVDLLVVETMMSLGEVRAALIATKEVSNLPIMVTLTFEQSGRTLFGTDAKTAAIVCESLGACAIGVNCSTGPKDMISIVEDMTSVTRVPIIAKPNAGLPALDAEGNTIYSMTESAFAEEMEYLVNAGASILGGCCGTTPDFIRAIVNKFGHTQEKHCNRRPDGVRYLTSERSTLAFGLEDPFIIVGERINPTGKKLLQAELRDGNTDLVLKFAQEQEKCGAQVLDVNMGMSGIDEKQMMLRVIEEVTTVTNLPLSLDSSYVDVLEAALRNYPGRALVNSVSLETEKFEKLLPIVAKYGAVFILLPLSDEGLPKDIDEKKQIIQKIYHRALELGLSIENIVVDGLVQTVGANPMAALETMDTIRYCKNEGFATICGLSNISFGMPERSYVNATFLSLAIASGLTMAISNPSQDLLVCSAFASDLLLAKNNSDLRYIEKVAQVKEEAEKKAALAASLPKDTSAHTDSVNQNSASKSASSLSSNSEASRSIGQEEVFQAVLKGNRNGIKKITQNAISNGDNPSDILNDALIPAINQVGDYFDQGKYFLPQLIGSAETMKLSIEVLEPLLAGNQSDEDKPVVVIATVEGDIHDIGKNLVAMMFKNYGFDVIDLGKDVPADTIVKVAKEKDASIIGLSALMTTTMQKMREVIDMAKAEGLKARIIIGGAVITQEYADEIGADGYSKDAAEAVKLAKRLLDLPL